jgi:hypothetical protein
VRIEARDESTAQEKAKTTAKTPIRKNQCKNKDKNLDNISRLIEAVEAARSYVELGKRWVVDLDLEKFFDRVNHDVLMARVARKVEDERVCTGQESDAGGDRQQKGVVGGHQRARSVVEWRRFAHECCLSEVLVRPYGVGFVAGSSATPYLCFMNRRMPNGTSCGVGGRRE